MDILVSIFNKEDGSSRQVRCPLQERVIVGRGAECSVAIDGPAISREHLVLELGPGNAVVASDASANGSWVNGERIPRSRRVPVHPADMIELPGFELRVQIAESAPAPAPPQAHASGFASDPTSGRRSGGSLAPVFALIASFDGGEKAAVMAALLSLALVLAYALS